MSSPTISPTQSDKILRQALGDDLQRATLWLVVYIAALAIIIGGFFSLLA